MEMNHNNGYNYSIEAKNYLLEEFVMDMSFMTIFDIIIGVLGIYLLFVGIKGFKKNEVDPMLITADELLKCKDVKALSKELMPKTAIFGAFCILFGIQGLLNDTGKILFPKAVNAVFLIAFVVIYGVFSYSLHSAKKKYIQ